MKSAAMDDAVKAGACYDVEELKKIFGRRKILSVKQIAALKIPKQDIIWALTRDHFLDTQDKAVRFAVFCANQNLSNFEKLFPNDLRPRQAIEAAERWRLNPTEENQKLARSAARSAAWSAESAESAAESAAWSAAWSAESAAWSAESAAWSAARSAARSAESAAESAASAAWSAESAARKDQIKFLVKMLSEQNHVVHKA